MSPYNLCFPVLIAILCVKSYHSYPFNDFRFNTWWSEIPKYPDTCCQLEWIDIKKTDPLPDSYVLAGRYMDRNWAFTRSSKPTTAAKSDRIGEAPNWVGRAELPIHPYPILSNPNNCTIGWHRTKSVKEPIPHSTDWFFPSLGRSKWGDFSRYQGSPGRTAYDTGYFLRMTSLTDFEIIEVTNIEQMYVDCKVSVRGMFKHSKISDIKIDKTVIDQLMNEGRVRNSYKIYENRNDSTSTLPFTSTTILSICINYTSDRFDIQRKNNQSHIKEKIFIALGFPVIDIDIHSSNCSSSRVEFTERKMIPANSYMNITKRIYSADVEMEIQVTDEISVIGTSVHTPIVLMKTLEKYRDTRQTVHEKDGKTYVTTDGYIKATVSSSILTDYSYPTKN